MNATMELTIDGDTTKTLDMTPGQLGEFRRHLMAVNEGLDGLWDLIGGPDQHGYPDVKNGLYMMAPGYQRLRDVLETRERLVRQAATAAKFAALDAEFPAAKELEPE